MVTQQEYQALHDRIAALREETIQRLSIELEENPHIAEGLIREISDRFDAIVKEDMEGPRPADGGLAQLAGVGKESADSLGETRLPQGIEPYDESVTSERTIAVGDLYYLYQHEALGAFRAVHRLQELFDAGALRLSSGEGAFALYQFDRRQVLRYTQRQRQIAYGRVLGYGRVPLPADARANSNFHKLFTHFNNEVAQYWRDKRITDVIRQRAYDPTFGNVAVVRRAGLDLRNNLKFMSYGNINALRVESMQILEETFRIFNAPDVKNLYGADNAWDTLEEILVRHLGERVETSPRQRMAVAGREVLRWLAHPHITQSNQTRFEALLRQIADYAEEWLTSAQALGMATRSATSTVIRRQPGRTVPSALPAQSRPRSSAYRNGMTG